MSGQSRIVWCTRTKGLWNTVRVRNTDTMEVSGLRLVRRTGYRHGTPTCASPSDSRPRTQTTTPDETPPTLPFTCPVAPRTSTSRIGLPHGSSHRPWSQKWSIRQEGFDCRRTRKGSGPCGPDQGPRRVTQSTSPTGPGLECLVPDQGPTPTLRVSGTRVPGPVSHNPLMEGVL